MSYLNYKEIGEGPVVVIAHGLLGMLDNWRTFSKKLAEEGYRVISIDQRNHGKSFHSEDFDYELLAEDLNQFVDEMELDKIHTIGHSMGGKMVMRFLELYPERVDKTIVVDISPSGSIGSHSNIFESLLSVDITQVQSRKEVERQLVSKGLELGVVYFLMKNLRRDPATGGYAWKANISALWDNYQHILAATTPASPIEKEVLFLAGSRSNYITAEDIDLIGKYYPNHRYEVIPDAGHWVHADNLDGLLSVVLDCLGKEASYKL